MSHKEDWEKIENFEQGKQINTINKYGFDIYENFKKKTSKEYLKKKNIFKRIITSISIIIFLFLILNYYLDILKYMRINELNGQYSLSFNEKRAGLNITGNGFYIYNVEEIPELEIHGFLHRGNDIFIEDTTERMYKYFFEKWKDPDKSKFHIDESYEDYKYGLHTEKNWFLRFKTYIEVNSYEEMLEATEIIIKFRNYMSYPEMIIESYIKYGDRFILPHNVSHQTDEEIRNMAKSEFLDNNSNYNYNRLKNEES